jgi:hypothetical protein
MFIGHFAVGFASKRVAPRTSLGFLMMAPLLADLLWPIFLLIGIEDVRVVPSTNPFTTLDFIRYPWSHSLLMLAVWGALFGALYAWRTGDRVAGWVLAAGVVSHWVLDWATHQPDLPLIPGGGPKVGLGLWYHPLATEIVECVMFVIGLAIYLRTTRPKSRAGTIGLWSFVVVLLALYVASNSGPPPPNAHAIGVFGLVGWLIALWIFWFDSKREPRPASTGA